MATIPASENEFPEVLLAEGAAPAAPGANLVKMYAKSDGLPYSKDDAGAESPMTPNAHIADTTAAHAGSAVSVDPTGLTVVTGTDAQTAIEELDAAIVGGGAVGTDVIWDAAGDLAVGTGSNTAARLAIGAVGGHLSRINGAVAWDSGTSNPGSAVAGDRFWRSDLGRAIYYDGTRWLTVQEMVLPIPLTDAFQFTGLSVALSTAGRSGVPPLANGAWLTRYSMGTLVLTTNDGSNFWGVTPEWITATSGVTAFTGFTTAAHTMGQFTMTTVTLGVVLDATARAIRVNVTKTASPGNIVGMGPMMMFYRTIIT